MAPIYIIILFLTPGDAMIDGDEDGADKNRACQKLMSVFSLPVEDVTFCKKATQCEEANNRDATIGTIMNC